MRLIRYLQELWATVTQLGECGSLDLAVLEAAYKSMNLNQLMALQ